MAEPQAASVLERTPLYDMHVRLGARMVPFAGYAMPLQYPPGIIKEHLHTRASASLFDVSHMGQIRLKPRSGDVADAARALESLVPADIVGLTSDRQRYTFFTTVSGAIIDDLMVSNAGNHLLLIVNAAGKAADETHLRENLSDSCIIERLTDYALIALQGPAAEAALSTFVSDVRTMHFMDVRAENLFGAPCTIARSGYTGEDGFEISTPAEKAEVLYKRLLENNDVLPAGLGARDSLRLEAGLCLYGSDLDLQTTPVEAALEWAIPKVRRSGAARSGGFPGADTILAQLIAGTARRRVGLKPEGRILVRSGALLYLTEADSAPIGTATSGCFGASLGFPVAMGYVPSPKTAAGTRLFADVRGKRLAVQVSELPFVPHRYKRT